MASHKTIKMVEDICKLGCNRVNEIIEQLERGESIGETTNLGQDETNTLLQELKSIMAIYNKQPR
jgi:hypothetical protein